MVIKLLPSKDNFASVTANPEKGHIAEIELTTDNVNFVLNKIAGMLK